ncbi:unnamed protein product, partial [Mesorhabditis belari]|uniref:Uncharacterized protein n=1 Tax=Mesorhabditis belari TaxID=2138241 RepID=A0AAF3F744_9BILA
MPKKNRKKRSNGSKSKTTITGNPEALPPNEPNEQPTAHLPSFPPGITSALISFLATSPDSEKYGPQFMRLLEIFKSKYFLPLRYELQLQAQAVGLARSYPVAEFTVEKWITEWGKRCEFVIDYLERVLPPELEQRNVNRQKVQEAIQRRGNTIKGLSLEFHRMSDWRKVAFVDPLRMIYTLSLELLKNPVINSVWFDGSWAYTSPDPNPSNEEKERIQNLWLGFETPLVVCMIVDT